MTDRQLVGRANPAPNAKHKPYQGSLTRMHTGFSSSLVVTIAKLIPTHLHMNMYITAMTAFKKNNNKFYFISARQSF